MGSDNYKQIPKDLREPIAIKLSDGTTRTFDNLEQAESFIRMEVVRGKKLTPDMENLSSLIKEKGGPNIDIYRIHGDIPAILSYAKQIGNLYADTHIAKELQ